MGVLNSASLVVTPNGYKASKLYSVIPTDGSGDMTFTRVGDTATRVNSSGLIETVLANKPRLDYTNSTCPKLLLEPQRTNLFTNSEAIDSAGLNEVTVTANAVNSPSGSQNAELVLETVTNSAHNIYKNPTVVSGTTYTSSIFVKKYATRRYVRVGFSATNSAFSLSYVVFDLDTGAVSLNSGSLPASIVSYGNGWYRISASATATASAVATLTYNFQNGNNINTYAGSTSEGMYMWGGQIEAGAYPSSYIPTTGSTVTRTLELFTKSGISNLLNSQAGTFVAFISPLKGNVGDLGGLKIDDSTNAGNYVTIQFRNSPENYIAGSYRLNGANVSFTQAINPNINAAIKVAYVYQNGSQKLFINGSLVFSTTAAISNSVIFDRVTSSGPATGVGAFSGNVEALLVYKTPLSDTDAIALTSL